LVNYRQGARHYSRFANVFVMRATLLTLDTVDGGIVQDAEDQELTAST
jgi:hypothetical protein